MNRLPAEGRATTGSPIGVHSYPRRDEAVARVDASVRVHLFVVPCNNSGSTYLAAALGQAAAAWRLPREGQFVDGFLGPTPAQFGANFLWAHQRSPFPRIAATDAFYDWEAIRRAWYGAAMPASDDACVLVEKSPPNVVRTLLLDSHFHTARFVFLVRDPLAVVESIVRARPDVPDVVARACEHVGAIQTRQRENCDRHGDRGLLIRYEDLCADPTGTAERIVALVPELAGLRLGQRLPVKGRYDEALTDMNALHWARLAPDQLRSALDHLSPWEDVVRGFGYPLA